MNYIFSIVTCRENIKMSTKKEEMKNYLTIALLNSRKTSNFAEK